jgi:hypothetical protein
MKRRAAAQRRSRLGAVAAGALRLPVRTMRRWPGPSLLACLAIAGTGAVTANALLLQTGKHPSPVFAQMLGAAPPAETGAPDAPVATATVAAEALPASDIVRTVQSGLARAGLYDGPIDGVNGPRTASAIVAFQRGSNLPESGEPSPALLAKLKAVPAVPLPRPKTLASRPAG